MNGLNEVPEFPQLWWRRFRDFKLAESAKIYVFDNPSLCFGAQIWCVLPANCHASAQAQAVTVCQVAKRPVFQAKGQCAGSDLRDEIHFVEMEVGRVKESYNTMTDSMHGVYAGIVDAELIHNPNMTYWNEWWNEFRGFRAGHRWTARHTWPGLVGNVYNTCDSSSPHPFCNPTEEDGIAWRANFRNFPLIMNVRFVDEATHTLVSRELYLTFDYWHRHHSGVGYHLVWCPIDFPELMHFMTACS